MRACTCFDACVDPVQTLIAREQIRELVHRYSVAISERDVDLMVSLYAPDASFGAAGSGPAALRELMDATMGDLVFGVILVANHSIAFVDPEHATGEVWARCYAQNDGGYYEQLIKYVDRYRLVSDDPVAPDWRFEHRRHLLWFGEAGPSPLGQGPAEWPKRQVGVGRIPLADDAVLAWRSSRRNSD